MPKDRQGFSTSPPDEHVAPLTSATSTVESEDDLAELSADVRLLVEKSRRVIAESRGIRLETRVLIASLRKEYPHYYR